MKVVRRRAGSAFVALWLLAASPAVLADDGVPSAPAAKEPQAVAPKMPADMDGVLLDDGRQIEGTFDERARQRWVITPKAGGAELNVSVKQIVVAEKEGTVWQRGTDTAAARVWRAAIRAEYCDAMARVVSECAQASLVDRARAGLKTMKEYGAAAARLARLEAALAGRTQTADPAAEEKAAAGENAAKAAMVVALGKGVDWCAKREFLTAATSLVNEIGSLDPTKSADAAARTKALMPEGFFFKDAPDAVAQWAKWAEALLPSSAQFADRADEDVWGRLENEPWTDGKTLCFRSPNVLLFIRDMDPAVCGKALRLAEGTVRALQIFLNEGEPDVVDGVGGLLEIRIHKSRADYLSEVPKRGKKAEEWTAGFFSPLDQISHFYVERGRGKDGAADMGSLTRVLTHEFTHHYISVRWMSRIITAQGAHQDTGGPGVWVVEGMAEFVQNQSHRADESEPPFDNDRAWGIDVTAQMHKTLKSPLLTVSKFVDLKQGDFESLSDSPMGMVKARHSQGGQGVSERSIWYDQAGALTYFFLQKKGPEIRKKFVRYVSDQYAGHGHVPGWQYFGYASAEEMDRDFEAFLRTVDG